MELFDLVRLPYVTFADRKIRFSTKCIRMFGNKNYVELLVNPVTKKFAIRPTDSSNRRGVYISKQKDLKFHPKEISAAAFTATLFALFGWRENYKYRIVGSLYENGNEFACIFDIADSMVLLPTQTVSVEDDESVQPLMQSGNRVRAVPPEWTTSFGKEFYLHERSLSALASQTKADWNLYMEGQLYELGQRLNITRFETLKLFIDSQLGDVITTMEGTDYV